MNPVRLLPMLDRSHRRRKFRRAEPNKPDRLGRVVHGTTGGDRRNVGGPVSPESCSGHVQSEGFPCAVEVWTSIGEHKL